MLVLSTASGDRKGKLLGVAEALKLFARESDRQVGCQLFAALSLALLAAILTAMAPVALQMLVDGLSPTSINSSAGGVALLVIAYLVSQWLARSFTEIRAGVYGRAEQRLQRRLSHRLFGHILGLPLAFHLDRKTGALTQILNNGLLGARIVVRHSVFTIVPVMVQLVTIASVLVYLDQPAFLGVILVSLIAYVAAFGIGVVRIAGPARSASLKNVDATGLMTDAILNFETVKHADAEMLVQRQYDAALERTEDNWGEFYKRKTSNGLLVAAVFALSLAGTVSLATLSVRNGTMSLGEFVLVNTYALQIVRPLEMVGFAIREVTQGLAFLDRLLSLLREDTEVQSRSGEAEVPDNRFGEIEFSHVRFGFNQERVVHEDLSFRCPPGHTLALVGPSGCGKSTIIRLLLRFFQPTNGEIVLDGVPVANWPVSDLRRAIAVVPQDTTLFNDTIANNIAFGQTGKSRSEIEHAARLANIHDFVADLPAGYETIVGERGMKLSGGEKQRIAIARAVLKKPRIFVFDEATSSLDTRTEQAILENLKGISKGVSTLFVAHRLSTIVHADEILLLEHGRVVERGSHWDLLNSGGRYADLWRAQRRGERCPDPAASENGEAIVA